MKKLISIILSLFALVGCSSNTYEQMEMNEGVEAFRNDSSSILIDVRRKDEFNSGHVPGAINVVNEEIDESVTEILKDKNQTIYVYCRSGNRSKQAAEKLVNLGYKHIIEIGGILDYKGELE